MTMTKKPMLLCIAAMVCAAPVVLVATFADAQIIAQQPAQSGVPLPGPFPGVRPPVARQIEPMVAPVRRAAPKQVTAVPARQMPTVAAAPVPASASGLGPNVATTGKAPAQAVATSTAAPQIPQALAPQGGVTQGVTSKVATKSITPRVVVHTCRVGQDWSDKLKSCFTPGVTKVAAATKSAVKSAKQKAVAAVDTAQRSALGAKRR